MGPMENVLPADRTLTITRDGSDCERLDPWPFVADELTVAVPWRTVPLAGYADDAALQTAIAAAAVEDRTTTLRPV